MPDKRPRKIRQPKKPAKQLANGLGSRSAGFPYYGLYQSRIYPYALNDIPLASMSHFRTSATEKRPCGLADRIKSVPLRFTT